LASASVTVRSAIAGQRGACHDGGIYARDIAATLLQLSMTVQSLPNAATFTERRDGTARFDKIVDERLWAPASGCNGPNGVD